MNELFKIEEPPFLDRLPELTYHLLKNIDPEFKFSLSYGGDTYDNLAFYLHEDKRGVFLPVNYFDGRIDFRVDDFDFYITFVEPFYYDIYTLYRFITMYTPNLYKIQFKTDIDDDLMYAIWVRSYNYFYRRQALRGMYANIFYNYKKLFDTDVDFKVKILMRDRTNVKICTNVPNVYTEFMNMENILGYSPEVILTDVKEDYVKIELPMHFILKNKTVYYRAHALTNLIDDIAKGISAWIH